jgi:diguanylate cyclase (GGDEF)-like protein
MTQDRERRHSLSSVVPAVPALELPRSFWRRLIAPPDPLQIDAGESGEVLVAQIRLLLAVLLLGIPALDLAWRTQALDAGFGITVLAVLSALGAWLLTQRGRYLPWLGFATSALDVTLVSLGYAFWLKVGTPTAARNSELVFAAYFLAIGATSLRYDVRVCLWAGLLAVGQYGAILLYANSHWLSARPGLAPFTPGLLSWGSQLPRLILLATAVALSITIVLRTQSLRRLSRSDRLTGLPNRGYFDERVEAEMSRARRHGLPIAVAIIDVDHFKRFNDTLGHAAGDVALKTVASTIRGSVRESDLVARYGGEEFVALFPGMSPQAALERMERIRRAVAEAVLPVAPREGQASVTISAGIAGLGVDGADVESLLDTADARLYQAKAGGRNRLVGPPREMANAPPGWRMSGGHIPGVPLNLK